MDINQLAALIQFVDEERRKDRAQIIQLQEKVDALTRENELRARYAQAVESQLNDLKQQVQKSMGWTSVVEQVRAEFGQMIERIEDQRAKSERESARIRQIEIEALVRQLNEQKREIKPYARYADEFEALKQEDARLNEAISRAQSTVLDIERRLDIPAASISYLEEQRRQDNKRLVALEQEVPDIRKRIEQFPPQLLLLDEAIRRKQTELEEAARILEAQSQVIEAQRVADIRRERQFAEYAEIVERLKERADAVAAQITGFVQMREEVRRALNEIPSALDRFEVRLNEVIEIQRDNEARAKRQADEFRDAMDKNWKNFVVSQEEKWHDRDRRIADYEPRLSALEEELPKYQPQILALYEIIDTFSKAYAAAGREWLSQANQMLEKARLNLPSEVNLSRRQRRKLKTQAEAEAAGGIPPNGAAHDEADDTASDDGRDDLDQDLIS
jgi:chromosome segregation ATPase